MGVERSLNMACACPTINSVQQTYHVDVDVERFAGAGLSLFACLLTNVITKYFTQIYTSYTC